MTYVVGDYRTTGSGTLNSTVENKLLEQYTSEGTWVVASSQLPSTATLFIEHDIQLAGTLQLSNLHIASNKVFTVSANASLVAGNKLTVAASAEMVQEGSVESRGLLQLQPLSKLTIKSPTYKASSPIWAGTEEIDATSEVRIVSAASNAVLFSSSQLSAQPHGYWFGKLSIAPTSTNGQWHLTDSSAPLAAQTFSTSLPASSSLLLLAGTGLSLQFGQDLRLSGGTYVMQNQSSGTGMLSITGELALQNATLSLNQTSSSEAITTINLKGHLSLDATSIIHNSSTVDTKASGIRFNGNTWQTIQVAGQVNHVSLFVGAGAQVKLGHSLRLNPINSVYAGTLVVENGGNLDFGTDATGNGFQVQGQGYFRMDQGGTLYITSAQGINTTGTEGNVQVSESRRAFTTLGTFIYNGKVPQQTGNAFPTTASGKVVIIDNPASVTLTNTIGFSVNTSVSPHGGRLEIKQGTFITTPTADVTGGGRLVMSGGTYRIARLGTIVPQLTGAYELTGGTIELNGNGEQILRGGTSYTYYNVLISGINENGTNAKTISTTTTINQNLTILPNAILDISNKSLKGDAGLTMTGGLFRTSRTSGSLPELLGRNTSYNLSGGTIEFYGSTNGQNQSIRGTYGTSQKIIYHNLLLTAAEANTLNETGNQLFSANFDVAGTLTVKAPAVLQIASNRAVGGTGNFIVEPGATLLYGSPQGIKLTGTGTLDGNVRVSGTRSFSPLANYGFIGNSDMVTGDGLPGTVANLLVAKISGGVTLSKPVQVTHVFTHKSGLFKTDVHELFLLKEETSVLQLTDPNFYIQGNLRRAVGSSGTYSFPVGNGAGKRQFDIISNGLSGNDFRSIVVGFKPLPSAQSASDMSLTENGLTYTHIESEGVWFVEPNTTPANGNFTALASLNGFTNLSDNRFALLVRPIGSINNKDWTTGGGTLEDAGKDGRTVSSGYAKRSFITTFGQVGIANIETVLPVTWLHVKAERKNQQVQVLWATATEINNDRFEVECSKDGKNFLKVGEVAGAGNSIITKEYQFQHVSPETATAYYRVKQIDFDGKYEYSKVVAVKAGKEALAQVALYPNPSQDFLHLLNITIEPSTMIEILDAKGKRINQIKPVLTGEATVVPVQHLSSGTYILRIQKAGTILQQRFVKL
ncbi:hypothetical protein DC20_00295 [Rufibacter tibetensis]|uniref:Secretion system C-terminal sorting domain-containing protein n=1 Tax=Rufibacter tibetensis TaxID=512763 RepID=A0A0P0BZ20_9BACT|nr:hypothetical protein DC20_00295 [Rufibacter tibetensis]